jgi:hypothetical protein
MEEKEFVKSEELPSQSPQDVREENFGCFVLVLVVILVVAMYEIFTAVGATGALGAGIASFGLALMGLGIVWIAAKYRGR